MLDCIVIGAGPGGLVCTKELLEQREFDKMKPILHGIRRSLALRGLPSAGAARPAERIVHEIANT